MNDYQEMRFGIFEGGQILSQLGQHPDVLSAVSGADNFAVALNSFQASLQNFDINHALDVNVFCLSE